MHDDPGEGSEDDVQRRLLALREPERAPLSTEELEARFAAFRGTLPVDGNLSADEIARAQKFTSNIDDPALRHDLEVDNAVLTLLANCEDSAAADFSAAFFCADDADGQDDYEDAQEALSPSLAARLRILGVDEETRQDLEAEDLALRMLAEAEAEGDNLGNFEPDPGGAPTVDEIALLLNEAKECSKLANEEKAEQSDTSIAESIDNSGGSEPNAIECADPATILAETERFCEMATRLENPDDDTRIMSSSGETVSALIELGLVKEAYEEQMAHCNFLFSKGKGKVDVQILHGAVEEAQRLKSQI